LLSERPAEVENPAVQGHWEGDLILGKKSKSVIATLVERQTRFVMLPALREGRLAEQVKDMLARPIKNLPALLRDSLTWDEARRWERIWTLLLKRVSRSTSAIRAVHGSAGQTKTATVSFGSTSPRGQICRSTRNANSIALPKSSTDALDKRSTGEHDPSLSLLCSDDRLRRSVQLQRISPNPSTRSTIGSSDTATSVASARSN